MLFFLKARRGLEKGGKGINWLLWASVDRKLKRPIFFPPAPAKKYKPSDQRNKNTRNLTCKKCHEMRKTNTNLTSKEIQTQKIFPPAPAKKYKSSDQPPRNTNTQNLNPRNATKWREKHPRLLPFYNSSPIFMKGCKPHSTLTYNPLYLLLPRDLNINESFQRFPKGDVECAHKIQSWNKNTREDINQGICFHEGIWKEEKQSAEIFQFSSQIKQIKFFNVSFWVAALWHYTKNVEN